MEVVKKTILRALTTGTTATTDGTKYIIIPDLLAVYNLKLGITSIVKDIGFLDTYVGKTYFGDIIPDDPNTPPITD